jgi:hypothetical protein
MGSSVLYELNIHVQLHIPRPLFSSLFSDQLPRMDDEPRTLIFFLLKSISRDTPYRFLLGQPIMTGKFQPKKFLSATSSCTAVNFQKQKRMLQQNVRASSL